MKSKPKLFFRNRYVLMGDLICVVVSVLGSYALRFELNASFYDYLPSAVWMILVALVIKPLVYFAFGLYQRLWIYASVQEAKLVLAAVTIASVPVSFIMILLHPLGAFTGFPRSVLFIDWLLSLAMVAGLRFSQRLISESRQPSRASGVPVKNVLIVGAGEAGVMVLRELQRNPQLNLKPVGFLDDDHAKLRQNIYGVPVVGTLGDMARVLDTRHVDHVVIAIPSAPGKTIRMVADVCRLKGMPFRTMPGIYELLGGKVVTNRLREVDITDLLRRETVRGREELIPEALAGRVILITGAGGSIGRELCRQIARWNPEKLIMLGHGENSIFEALLEMREVFPQVETVPVIADVRDRNRLEATFAKHHPQIVFHTAAHKHVPLMQANIEEVITNNVLGTYNLVQTALKYDVQRLVMISTDKAVRPANVYGATKRIGEMLVTDAAERSGRAFSVVRFGNVLGSRGSVVPIFKSQIARGGPVTVTHPEMKRYFMTIPEAVYLVLQAASMGTGGETFILNMGQQVRILSLVEDLIRLSGLEPGRDIEIVFTGIRPGEKLSEELWDEGHTFSATQHPDVFRLESQPETLRGEALEHAVQDLIRMARSNDVQTIAEILDDMIPGATVLQAPSLEINSIE